MTPLHSEQDRVAGTVCGAAGVCTKSIQGRPKAQPFGSQILFHASRPIFGAMRRGPFVCTCAFERKHKLQFKRRPEARMINFVRPRGADFQSRERLPSFRAGHYILVVRLIQHHQTSAWLRLPPSGPICLDDPAALPLFLCYGHTSPISALRAHHLFTFQGFHSPHSPVTCRMHEA